MNRINPTHVVASDDGWRTGTKLTDVLLRASLLVDSSLCVSNLTNLKELLLGTNVVELPLRQYPDTTTDTEMSLPFGFSSI